MDEIKRATKELTPNEKKRVEKFDKIVEELERKGYKRKDLTISIEQANMEGMIFPLPFVIIFVILNFIIFKKPITEGYHLLLFIPGMLLGVVIHELIHGLTWGLVAKDHFKNIEFGFVEKEFTPYCYCGTALSKVKYILGSIMPFIVIGIIPATISLFISNNITLFLISIIMIFGAAGDLTIIWLILKNKSKKKSVLYIDHPVDCGVVMFEK